ncbi:uncharacterized protein BT62DRAFT_931999 [Guyanagaster necrorhizus]|uniref:CUE domain-containing protein n=1 Tax=Guyanagaster necrorhizus TaxID=856835 RepID=A0A9P7VVC4_9AGAR|nr:uncharacterized protein BT62DRAFT_931999 [Guyanagaster necrorhizus MCA 3950]KAG7446561.1 hypothetical protein BT62DRAFT_931999 [Guyanagaster necrorhizus MCA 3950]
MDSPTNHGTASPPNDAHPTATEQLPLATEAAAQLTPSMRDAPVNPQVVELRAMFPDFDDTVLQSVLDSVYGDQGRAIDALLGMSDPEYKDEPRSVERVMTQTELDEQLARRLLLEDQQQQQAAWQSQQPQWQQPIPVRRQSQPVPEKDTMAELGEQFNKFAESGKKTLGSLFSKVKAKISEMDQSRQNNNAASSSASQQSWTAGGNAYSYDDSHGSGQQASYYDPNPPPINDTNKPASPSPVPAQVRGYDLTPSPKEETVPRPPSAGQGMPIDGGKLGLLPKRPVSLFRTSTPPVDGQLGPPTKIESDNDHDLEYVENPFEDGRK